MLKEIFSQKLNTQSKTVNNAIITLGDTDDSGKGKLFKSRFIQPGLAGYPGQYGNALIKKKNLDRFIYTLRGKPVIINHKSQITDDDKVGEVHDVWFNPDDGWYWCNGVIWDETAQNLITDKGWSVSCSYCYTKCDDAGGTENNIPYDIEFLDGEFEHLAIVDNPRYERANIVFNSKTALVDNDKWITIKPHGKDSDDYRRIKLEDGETPKEAIERTYKKEDSEKGKKEYTWKNQKYSLQDLVDAGFEPIKYTSSIYKDDPLTYLKKEEGKKYYRVPLTESEYQEALKAKENKKTNALIKAKKESKDLIDYVKWQYNEDIEPYITRKEGDKTIVDWYDLPRGAKSALQQIQRGGRLSLDMYSGREMSIEIIDKKILENLQRHRANNNKEQDMKLLDELKKLITKVENDKGEDMDKEKVENEKVDKRDIIRQIMAIAGKHEDNEDVRTIAKLAEKLAYDKSEAGTADNACDDDEEEVKNKKVKNEETEKDKEEYEEFKKDIKEDVENKCKNSVENSKNGGYFDKMNEIYNSANEPKEENLYISREQKLKDAETYFAK